MSHSYRKNEIVGNLQSIGKKRLNMSLSTLIITLEGYIPHIKDLSNDNAEKELFIINKVVREFFEISEKIAKINYFEDVEIKEKYLHAIKLLNTVENKLHKVVYKNKPIIKTPVEIIEGVARMNRQNLDKLLSV
jgi:hypothetical protein